MRRFLFIIVLFFLFYSTSLFAAPIDNQFDVSCKLGKISFKTIQGIEKIETIPPEGGSFVFKNEETAETFSVTVKCTCVLNATCELERVNVTDGSKTDGGSSGPGSGQVVKEPPKTPSSQVYALITNPTNEVGEQHIVTALIDKKPCALCTLVITDPKKKETRFTTDAKGNALVPLPYKGGYGIKLLSRQGLVAQEKGVVATLTLSPEQFVKKPIAFLADSDIQLDLLLLLIIIILTLLYLYNRWRNKNKKKPYVQKKKEDGE